MRAPTPALYFITGELPIEGKIHRDIFSLFYSIWTNPETKIFEVVKYLLKSSNDNSRTWSAHLRHLCRRYNLEDPLLYLQMDPPEKSSYKENILTKITSYYEKKLRQEALNNSRMTYFNVTTQGLRSRTHRAICDLLTVYQVKLARPHIKMLMGDYATLAIKFIQSGGSPDCIICTGNYRESICHLIASCSALAEERAQILTKYEQLCTDTIAKLDLNQIIANEETFCQFVLDPTSLNLKVMVNFNDPLVSEFFKLSREFCFLIDKLRTETMNRNKPKCLQ